MAHNKTIQAIRIYLDSAAAENLALGIFTVPESNSEIRLTEEPLVGTALEWKHGLIAKNGIGPRSEGGTIEGGGVPADYSGMTVDLQNTGRYLIALRDLGIELVGLTVELWEFIGSETDSDAVSGGVVFTGVIEDMAWDQAALGIPIKNAYYKRNAQILKTVNTTDFPGASNDMVGKMIPATFGKLYPVISNGVFTIESIAKFIRIEDEYDETSINNDILAGGNADTIQFPITSIDLISGVPLAYTFVVNGQGGDAPDATDVYAIITEGTGSGQIKKVDSFVSDLSYGVYHFYIATVFETELSVATDGTRSWVQFVKIKRKYCADSWPCKAFLSNTTGSETTSPELYAIKE